MRGGRVPADATRERLFRRETEWNFGKPRGFVRRLRMNAALPRVTAPGRSARRSPR